MTSRFQVTLPKAPAECYGIRSGDDIQFEAAGEVMCVVSASAGASGEGLDIEARLHLFDAATERQRKRARRRPGRPRKHAWLDPPGVL
ncbi:MAG: hypothetical protein OXQ84_08940 [bacterium]|nr:hypothetical protein [bacterium]